MSCWRCGTSASRVTNDVAHASRAQGTAVRLRRACTTAVVNRHQRVGIPSPQNSHKSSHITDNMHYTTLRYEVQDRILTLTLARPESLNAFTVAMSH